jgi:hypothetical protein
LFALDRLGYAPSMTTTPNSPDDSSDPNRTTPDRDNLEHDENTAQPDEVPERAAGQGEPIEPPD